MYNGSINNRVQFFVLFVGKFDGNLVFFELYKIMLALRVE